MMPETVKVPGVGPTKRTWVYAGGALLIGVVGYAWWRSRGVTPVEPINPDALPQDRVPFTDADVSSGLSESTTAGLPMTVADWVQRATDRLIELGRDPILAASALGKFITRQPLTADEESVVRSAIGQFGTPPGGDTYPILRATPEPSTPPAMTTWRGHRLESNITWGQLASAYSESKSATGIYSTKKALLAHNPTITARIGTKDSAILKQGWIVLIPVRK